MENEKVIEMNEETTETTKEVAEMKESKVKGLIGKVGSGIKKNWKLIAVGAGALVVGTILGKKSANAEDDIVDVEFEEIEDSKDDDTIE